MTTELLYPHPSSHLLPIDASSNPQALEPNNVVVNYDLCGMVLVCVLEYIVNIYSTFINSSLGC